MAQMNGGFTTLIARALFKQPDLNLHFHPFSFYSRLILMALYEKRLPFSQQFVDTSQEDQFYDGGLGFNHLGDYPVLWDGKHHVAIKDPADIVRHLDANYKGRTALQPDDRTEAYIHDEIVRRVQHLRLETLTIGSIMFTDLSLEPKGPYQIEAIRTRMMEGLQKRHAVFQDDLSDMDEDMAAINDLDGWHLLQSRENFEALLTGFERELDHCEFELRNRSFKEPDPSKQWLISSKLTFADICLGMTLWHLDQLGFYRQMIAPKTNISQYYVRIQRLESFKRATTYHPTCFQMPCPTANVAAAVRRAWLFPENPWSFLFLMLPVGMIAFIAIVDYLKPLGPKDQYYVPPLRPHLPQLQYQYRSSDR